MAEVKDEPLTEEELKRYAALGVYPFTGIPDDIRAALVRLVAEVSRLRADLDRAHEFMRLKAINIREDAAALDLFTRKDE